MARIVNGRPVGIQQQQQFGRPALPPMGGSLAGQYPGSAPQMAPQMNVPMGGVAGGGGVHPAVVRREMSQVAQIEQMLRDQLGAIEQRIASGEARLEDLIRVQPSAALGGVGAVPADAVKQFGAALSDGRVLPYVLSIDVPLRKGQQGEQEVGEVVATADGPLFVSQLWAYAQISAGDPDAQNYPFSLIKRPSCDPTCGDSAFSEQDSEASFDISCDSLLPGIDVGGMFIPISPKNCKVITAGTDVCCATLTCPDGSKQSFSAVVPIVLLDHPDCIDGLVEIVQNGCGWQNVQFPLAFFDEGFDITNEVPDCIGLGGYLDCQKIVSIGLTPTRAPRFNTVVTFVLAGFRMITCGGGSCGAPATAG